MKGKKKLFALLALVLMVATVVSLLVFSTNAADQTPVLSIDYCNLSFSDSIYIKYAVASNVSDAKLLIWTEPQTEYVKGTEKDALSPIGTETISGKEYAIYNYTKLAAKQMTDVVYARVWVKADGEDYYSAPHKYSILQYVYNKNGKLGAGTSDENLKNLLASMLSYGADAQTYFGYKTDRLATSDFYQVKLTAGKLSDGFANGLYLAGEQVKLSAPATDANGATFSYWQDSKGAKVSNDATFELTVSGKNEVYTPVYVKVSKGLEIDEDGYVLSMGDCTDTDVVIPAKTAEGVTVVGIDNSAFAGEPITSITIPSTVVEIGRKAFNGCTALKDVYYDGTEEEWNEKVSVSSNNDPLLDATFHFVIPPAVTYTVTFKDHDGTVLKTETVEEGKAATAPTAPTREGYTFIGWDKAFANVTSDLVVTAKYDIEVTGPALILNGATASAGATDVVVTVSVKNNPGIMGAIFSISYDDSVLTLTNATNGVTAKGVSYTEPSRYKDPTMFIWDALDLTWTEDGVILNLTFSVDSAAQAGNYPITLNYAPNDMRGEDGVSLDFAVVNTAIEVK